MFKPFLRLDDARNQDEGGTGLGLAIARDIARSHGGDITLGDSPLGGLRATVRGAGLTLLPALNRSARFPYVVANNASGEATMAVDEETKADNESESRPFEADVAKLLHLMVHSVYSDKSVFLRELIANAADACERLRYEAIADPALLGDDAKPRITVALDPDADSSAVEDNGIGMSRDEMVEALGTIARSGTKAFLERIEAAQSRSGQGGQEGDEDNALIGRFGVGFYSAFMVAERVEVMSRRAGTRCGLAVVVRRQGRILRFAACRRSPRRRVAAPASCCICWRTPRAMPSAPPSSP